MTASALSLKGTSGLKSFHKSRLLSKQRLIKRQRENLALTTGAGSMWSPVGWLVGFEATGFGWEAYCDSWLASQPVSQHRPDQVSWSSSHAWGVGSAGKGGATWFGMLLWYNTENWITPNKCGMNLRPLEFFSLLLFAKSWLVSTPVAKHRGNRDKHGRKSRRQTVSGAQGKWCDKKPGISICC